jgi:uncharacterized protein YegP (UPF0339 family)
MPGKYEIHRARDGQYHFHLRAANGEIILSSELYQTRGGAKSGIASVQHNGANADRFERRTDKRGRPYFVLKAGNHQIIGTSEMYESAAAMEKGIKSVIRNAGASVEDLTQ